MTLDDVLRAAAETLDPSPMAGELPDGSVEWSRDGIVFASIEMTGDAAAFRLDPMLADAARRTPDTAPTPLGNDWVIFAPGVIDGHAADRARAWFEAAHRRAVRD
ncbi:MAG TPA: hypothetical protein VD763_05320 [Candidatus Saccharimonadales bacterium]|nr:hypothetical protein [Candidatus Saccharimonadales bacterium]